MTHVHNSDQTDSKSSRPPGNRGFKLSLIGPGILVAATGVGAGDLATATITGSKLGTTILWAVLVGASLKYVLNEGLTRWQLATQTTLLEGTVQHLGRIARYTFLAYLIVWSFLVAMALMSACGVAAHAIFPIFQDASTGKTVYGIIQSLIAVALVMAGGYQLFEKVMGVCIGVMFFVVVGTAVALRPAFGEFVYGLSIPTIPQFFDGGLEWTIALLGGVGGTVTVLCYGYWIREESRNSIHDLHTCRLDLAIGYVTTAIFGVAMVIIGSQLGELEGGGATLVVEVGRTLEERLGVAGPIAKWSFLIGAWGAVFSSLLGVWQSVPYIYTDLWRLWFRSGSGEVESPEMAIDTKSAVYRSHLVAIALVPISGLFVFDFKSAMKVNGMVGAIFIPMLAIVLLLLNGNARWIGSENRNSRWVSALLVLTLLLSLVAMLFKLRNDFL